MFHLNFRISAGGFCPTSIGRPPLEADSGAAEVPALLARTQLMMDWIVDGTRNSSHEDFESLG